MRLRAIVMVGDILLILLAFGLASLVKSSGGAFLTLPAVIIPIYLGTGLSAQAYTMRIAQASDSTSSALRSLLFAYGTLFLLLYFVRTQNEVSRLFLVSTMLLSALLLTTFRQLVAWVVRDRLRDRLSAELVIVDGVTIDAPRGGAVMLDAAARDIQPDLADPGCLNRFAALVRDMDRVVIACRPEKRESWAMMLKGANVLGEVIVDDIGAFGAFGLSSMDGHQTLLVAAGPLTLSQRITKRMFDLALTVPALIALGPVLLLVALAVKIDSRGPVFFRQRRVGRGNAFFEILKFRSMRVDQSDHDGAVSTSGRHDSRITRVGRFIRSTSLDELPQLLNVLSGSMSLVGPRPHALGSLAGNELFWEVDYRYWHRHACKPGLTGLAQVRGFRGATLKREDLVNRLQADLEYLNGWNIWRDISIMFATVRVLVHPNAF